VTGKYAKDTTVTVERSLDEIRSTVKRYGASKIATYEDDDRVVFAFEMRQRQVKFVMPLPQKKDYVYEENNRYGKKGQFSPNAYEQGVRQRWRALLLCIKAKLESVESGIETFDEAFMAQLVLPSGDTMGAWAKPQLDAIYKSGSMPMLLPSGETR